MRTEELLYAMEVQRFGSISEAAKHLNISSQGLGKAIRHLECELDCELFERRNTGVKLTPVGRELYRHFELMVKEEKKVMDLIAASKSHAAAYQILFVSSKLSDDLDEAMDHFNSASVKKYELVHLQNDKFENEDAFLNENYSYRICSRHNCVKSWNLPFVPLLEMVHSPVVSLQSELSEKNTISLSDLWNHTILIEADNYPYVGLLRQKLKVFGVETRFRVVSDKLYLYEYLERYPEAIFFCTKKDQERLCELRKCVRLELDPPHRVELGIQCKLNAPDADLIQFLKEFFKNI